MTQSQRAHDRPHLDDVSKAIIEQLQQDGRRSYAAIGKVVGLSEAAVRQRVQRLLDAGVMQVVAVTDPLELISEKIRSIDSVISTETFMYLKLHKQTYSWGVR